MAGYFIHATVINDEELKPTVLIINPEANPNMPIVYCLSV